MQISRVIRSFASTSCQRIHIARYTTSGPPGPKFNLEEWEQLTDEANPPELDESYKRHSSQRAQGVIDETVKSFVDSAARRTLERNGELNSEADPDALEAFSVESNPPELLEDYKRHLSSSANRFLGGGLPDSARRLFKIEDKKLCIVLSAIFTVNAQNAGPFQVGRRTIPAITRNDGQESFGAFMYYPAMSEGENATPDIAKAPYPLISFAHGFLGPPLVYATLNTHIASWGYIVIATASEVTAQVNQTRYVEDILRCAEFVQQESAQEGPFKGMASKEVGLVGHSMGGGAILRAAVKDPSVKVLVGLAAAANQTTSQGVSTPSRLIVGTNDTVVPPSTAVSQWEGLDGPRQIYEIIGGTHCGFIDLDLDGLPICDKAVMPRAEQRAMQNGLVVAFLNEYLKANPANSTSWLDVWGPGAVNASSNDPRLRTKIDPRVVMSPAASTLSAGVSSVTYQLTSNRPAPISYQPIVPAGYSTTSQAIQLVQGTPQNFTVTVSPKRLMARADQVIVSVLNEADMGTRGFAIVNPSGNVVPSSAPHRFKACIAMAIIFIVM